jgi:3-hydroxybutyryl-CoA dehydrogenase
MAMGGTLIGFRAMTDIERVGVVGAGLMGHGIAQAAAASGLDVVIRDLDPDALARGLERIEKDLARAVDRGRMAADAADATRGRLRGTTDVADLADRQLVIEAIVERRDAKLALWRELDPVVDPDALFATNTSSLSVVEQAAATQRPDRFLGLHFFSPVQAMALVEVVRCVTTSEATVEAGMAFARRIGKQPVAARDTAGFLVNRLLVPYMVDAIRGLEEGIGTIEEIDEGMKGGAGHPMGPLTLCDFVGLDTLGQVCEVMYAEFLERRFAAPPTLRKMLAAGWLGRKSGIGFYDYTGTRPAPNPAL